MKRITRVVLPATALVAVLSALPALGDEGTENKGFMAAKGRVTFSRYCASCHGEKADGTGPVARMLKIPPTDLRLITIENDGEYPTERLTAFIDGREDVKAHGSRDMPVWGDVFKTPLVADPGAQDEEAANRAARKIRELALYVETLQQQPGAVAETESEER